jgi:hypothetical protein
MDNVVAAAQQTNLRCNQLMEMLPTAFCGKIRLCNAFVLQNGSLADMMSFDLDFLESNQKNNFVFLSSQFKVQIIKEYCRLLNLKVNIFAAEDIFNVEHLNKIQRIQQPVNLRRILKLRSLALTSCYFDKILFYNSLKFEESIREYIHDGFMLVDHTTLPLQTLINLIGGANEILFYDNKLLINSIYCKPGAKVYSIKYSDNSESDVDVHTVFFDAIKNVNENIHKLLPHIQHTFLTL